MLNTACSLSAERANDRTSHASDKNTTLTKANVTTEQFKIHQNNFLNINASYKDVNSGYWKVFSDHIPKVKIVKSLLLFLYHCTFTMHSPRV